MYAVIETGGKQYRVEAGDVLDVELLPGLEEGAEEVVFDRVLMVGGDGTPKVGTPLLEGASVRAVPVAEHRGPKVIVFKKKRRKGYKKTQGHRQDYYRVRVEAIEA